MMRAVQRNLTKVTFDYDETPLTTTWLGDEIIRTNTDPEQTIPMDSIKRSRIWSIWARQDLPEDAWLLK